MIIVAPLAGAWIEIMMQAVWNLYTMVAPLAGAWIEIFDRASSYPDVMSLPSRERGLKYPVSPRRIIWQCRSPRGSVD